MPQVYASLEVFRWGFAHLPGAVFYYAKELDLDMEDIGIISALFYAFESAKPLFQSGVRTGQVLQACSTLNAQKLSRKLARLTKQGLIDMEDGDTKNFTDKIIFIDPLMDKLQQLVIRDHPKFLRNAFIDNSNVQMQEYQARITQLELELENEKNGHIEIHKATQGNPMNDNVNFKMVADFIAKKSGNLLSVKMEHELQKWLDEMDFTPEFLLCMLELTFERKIHNPREISKIAQDLKDYSVNTVEGLEAYFNTYVDLKPANTRSNQFDPDIAEFGSFTGIDMNAEARKKIYYKWRYDWRFSHQMIMKAGEIMCQRTKNGGLEYIDSVLNNWMSKEIRSLPEAEKEIAEYKNRTKSAKAAVVTSEKPSPKRSGREYEMYVPPEVLEELKSKA